MSRPRSGTTSTDDERARMVARQLRDRGIEDERVLAAMAALPRERFLPEGARAGAYRDGAVAIGEGQTMSQPWIVARMAELLALGGDERVLEIGTGSGYAAAVLSHCCREVVSVERHDALAARAREALAAVGCENVDVRVGDGAAGAPDRAPFGGISVAATAEAGPPIPLFEQLEPGGVLVCPVRAADGDEQLMRYRDGVGEAVVPVRFVPLVEEPPEALPDEPPPA